MCGIYLTSSFAHKRNASTLRGALASEDRRLVRDRGKHCDPAGIQPKLRDHSEKEPRPRRRAAAGPNGGSLMISSRRRFAVLATALFCVAATVVPALAQTKPVI